MLVKCKRALLLSDVTSFSNMYRELADEVGVDLTVETDWTDKYRIKQEVVILGSKFLEKISKTYYSSVVLILKSDESPYPYIQQGITRFIFDYHNKYELFTALFKEEPIYVSYASMELKDLVKEYNSDSFRYKDYDFDFLGDSFRYKGKALYITKAQKRYLAEWLLNGHKDNSKRMLLFDLRKKFGNDFLREVDRHGQIEEEKDEQ